MHLLLTAWGQFLSASICSEPICNCFVRLITLMISAIEKLICLGIADWQPKQPQLLASGSREGGACSSWVSALGSYKVQLYCICLGPKRICLQLLRDKSYLLATAQRRFLSASICFWTNFEVRGTASICFYLLCVPPCRVRARRWHEEILKQFLFKFHR